MEPVESILRNIYQSNTYRKDLTWSHFDDEPSVQEKQQVKHQQSCIFVFVAYLTIPSSNNSLDVITKQFGERLKDISITKKIEQLQKTVSLGIAGMY